MQFNSSDAVVVRLVNTTRELEDVAEAAAEYIERARSKGEDMTPLRKMIVEKLRMASLAGGIARRNFRYGHDCDQIKCDGDSHK